MKSPVILTVSIVCFILMATGAFAQGGGGEKIPDPTKTPTKTPKSTPREPKPTRQPSLPKPKAPTVADLSINSNLPGCAVTLNGRSSGVTDSNGSLFLRSLKPGSYTVALTKQGYQSSQQPISLAAGESQSLSFELTAVPGTLTVTTDVSGAQIEISNAGSYSDRVNGLTLAPGSYHLTASKPGYRTTGRDFEIRTGETTTLPLNLEVIPVEETLAEALMAYNSKDYGRVFNLCNQVLSRESNNAKAHWLIGLSYYSQSRYAESVEPFAQAIAAGGQVRLNIRHRRYVFGAGDDLSNGVLSLDLARFAFTSNDRPGDSFTVPLSKVLNVKKELKRSQFGEWRFEVKVAIPKKDGKEDKKDLDFYSMRSGTKQVMFEGNKYPTSVIYCDDCEGEIDALYQLISRVKAMPQVTAGPDDGTPGRPTLTRREAATDSTTKNVPSAPPSSNLRPYTSQLNFRIGVPDNWVEVTKTARTIVFAPEGAYSKIGERYNFSHGMQIGTVPSQGLALADALERAVTAVIKDSGYLKRVAANQPGDIKGRPGLSVPLRGKSPVTQRDEFALIYAVMLKNGDMLYVIAVTPQQEVSIYSPTFGKIIASIEFLD